MVPNTTLSNTNSANSQDWHGISIEYERRVEPFTSSFVEELISAFVTAVVDNESSSASVEEDGNNHSNKKKKRLLDVGCGCGLGASIAYETNLFDVTACDVSQTMIDRLQLRFPHIPSFCFDCSSDDIDYLSLLFDNNNNNNNKFDYVMGSFSVIFFPNPQIGLERIRTTALVDDGTVAISAWGNPNETPAFQIFPRAVKSTDSIPDDIYSTHGKPNRITGSKETLTTLLVNSGYINVSVQGPITRYIEVPTAEEFYNRFALTSPNTMNLLKQLNEQQIEDLKSNVMSLAIQQSTKDDCISIPSSCYFAYGTKPSE